MMPPDLFLFLHHQRQQELMRQAEQARLVRSSIGKPESSERVFQPFLWWVGEMLLSWGCTLQGARGATNGVERGGCVCL